MPVHACLVDVWEGGPWVGWMRSSCSTHLSLYISSNEGGPELAAAKAAGSSAGDGFCRLLGPDCRHPRVLCT